MAFVRYTWVFLIEIYVISPGLIDSQKLDFVWLCTSGQTCGKKPEMFCLEPFGSNACDDSSTPIHTRRLLDDCDVSNITSRNVCMVTCFPPSHPSIVLICSIYVTGCKYAHCYSHPSSNSTQSLLPTTASTTTIPVSKTSATAVTTTRTAAAIPVSSTRSVIVEATDVTRESRSENRTAPDSRSEDDGTGDAVIIIASVVVGGVIICVTIAIGLVLYYCYKRGSEPVTIGQDDDYLTPCTPQPIYEVAL